MPLADTIAISVGVVVALALVGVIIWLFASKKNVTKAAKQGKKYLETNKLTSLKCRIKPTNWLNPSTCSQPSTATAQSTTKQTLAV